MSEINTPEIKDRGGAGDRCAAVHALEINTLEMNALRISKAPEMNAPWVDGAREINTSRIEASLEINEPHTYAPDTSVVAAAKDDEAGGVQGVLRRGRRRATNWARCHRGPQ